MQIDKTCLVNLVIFPDPVMIMCYSNNMSSQEHLDETIQIFVYKDCYTCLLYANSLLFTDTRL